jgi:hypothetical protein
LNAFPECEEAFDPPRLVGVMTLGRWLGYLWNPEDVEVPQCRHAITTNLGMEATLGVAATDKTGFLEALGPP